MDSTHSLAQVLRVPGTVNRKAKPAPVRVIAPAALDGDVPRCDPLDFEAFLPDEAAAPAPVPAAPATPPAAPAAAPPAAALRLSADANPPVEKLEALRVNDPKFAASWNRDRPDFKDDQSASAYEMSLASLAAAAGWTDQEVAALLVAWRRKHGEDVGKALRQDYMRRTIDKAREGVRRAGDPLEVLRQALGLPVLKVVKRGHPGGSFELHLAGGAYVDLGAAAQVLRPDAVRAAVADCTGKVLRSFKGQQWAPIAQAVLDAAQVVAVGTDEEETREWLCELLRGRTRIDLKDADDDAVIFARESFLDKGTGKACIYLPDLISFVTLCLHRQVSAKELPLRLSRLGFTPERFQRRVKGRLFKRRLWVSPGPWEGGEHDPGGAPP
ncbi:MAG: hypothetical protein NTX87_02415 [Planctomycetota bacterium]|nr:hypothetical protein [Planctomycetota bacterium]